MLWERKLLDFSLRNNLINIRKGKRVLPLAYPPNELEDRIFDGETLKLTPELTGCETEAELQTALKFIYRTSRTAMEENGANSLFIALGKLKWYETPKNEKERFAPILLLPVEIVRKGGGAGYVVRGREEEVILNTTLVELLKQQFKIDISGLNPLPKDEKGVDVSAVFESIRGHITSQNGWEVVEESMLGLFSFNKFVMWNDIHTNAHKLKENVILTSLMENRITWEDKIPEVNAREVDKTLEPSQFAIPLDVDSSQLEAVIESGEGKSFILHGPPGTGKSQTITNMIADALYRGKRVLFVAEKMAALSVVQKRLARIGLDPFCLELHSNKVTKSHFLSQMQRALDVVHIQSPDEYASTSRQLFEKRQELIQYMEALHKPQASGYSLYDCITHYLSIDGEELPLELSDFAGFKKEHIESVREKMTALDTVFRISGHPHNHPLSGLEPYRVSVESSQQLKEGLQTFREQLKSYVALLTFMADKPQWVGEPVSWLKAMTPVTDATAHVADMELLGSLNNEWAAINRKWFIPKFFSKNGFTNKVKEQYTVLKEELEKTYTELTALARMELPQENMTIGILSDMDRPHPENKKIIETILKSK